MLYFNTTTDKRYNERTLALYGFSPEDNDVHELQVNYPEVDERFESYRDTREVDVDGAIVSVRFEIVDLPKERVLENVRPLYEQALYVKRHENIDVDTHEVRSPVEALTTLTAWKAAIQNSIPFEPTQHPLVDNTTPMDVALIDTLIAGVNEHLQACDLLAGEVDTYLDASDVPTLKTTDIAEWVNNQYQALVAA